MSNNTPTSGDRAAALTSIAHVNLRGEKRSGFNRIFPPLFLAVLFILLMVALITGVNAYSAVASAQDAGNQTREGLELISNSVRANDATGSIAVGQGPEGKSLVVVQNLESGVYEIRTYLYQGKVVQEYAVQGNQYNPQTADVLAESSNFDFSFADGLLTIKTDQGTTEIALRNLQGGE